MIYTARDIAQQLAVRADQYARFLLPNGVMQNGSWCAGSVAGEAGHSLRVHVTGTLAGVWADFAGSPDDRGDLLDLTAAVKNVKLGEAIRFAKDWLGIREPQGVVPPKQYSKPKGKKIAPLSAESLVMDYLGDDRKIDGLTQITFHISEETCPQHGVEIVFPYYALDGELLNVKRIALGRSETGKKFCHLEKDCAPALFGWQALTQDVREVIITEGEIDAMTWAQMGFYALSVPNGAESTTWIDYEWENLQQFDVIYLNWDSDEAGQKGVKHVARRLGFSRCLILKLPGYKDANDALMAEESEAFFAEAIAQARPIIPEQIKTANDYAQKVVEKFYPSNGVPLGFFSSLFERQLGMRPGEVSIWTGIAGHGKSVMLSQVMLEAILLGKKVAIASMEMRGEQTLHRMLCQSENTNLPSEQVIREDLDWLSGKLWIYDLLGNVQTKLLFELMEYSYTRHGVEFFVIDSLMKCAVGVDDYEGQKVFLNDLCSFAKDTGTHVNLVAHARKGKDEADKPGKLDVLGASAIINQADNILVVWRNKSKEAKVFKGETPDANTPDSIIYCNKQRENGVEFQARMEFLKGVFRFKAFRRDLEDLSISERVHPEEPELSTQDQSQEQQPELTTNQ